MNFNVAATITTPTGSVRELASFETYADAIEWLAYLKAECGLIDMTVARRSVYGYTETDRFVQLVSISDAQLNEDVAAASR